MEPLHLSTSSVAYATRRVSRRVVWIGLCCGLVFLWISHFFSSFIIRHPTTLSLIPEDSAIAVRFTPERSSWSKILVFLDRVPLVSNVPITLSDLAPFIHGEFTLFFDHSGKVSCGLRARDGSLASLQQHFPSLQITQTAENSYLLSEVPVNMKQADLSTPWQTFLLPPTLNPTVGTVHLLHDRSLVGKMKLKDNILTIQFPKFISDSPEGIYPQASDIVFLSTPVLTKINPKIFLTDHKNRVSNVLNQGRITLVMQQTNEEMHQLLVMDGADVEETQLVAGLQEALQNPVVQETKTSENETIQEILLSDQNPDIAVTDTQGWKIFNGRTSDRSLVFGVKGKTTVLTEDEHTLFAHTRPMSIKPPCFGNVGQIDFNTINAKQQGIEEPGLPPSITIFFSRMSISNTSLSTNIELCR